MQPQNRATEPNTKVSHRIRPLFAPKEGIFIALKFFFFLKKICHISFRLLFICEKVLGEKRVWANNSGLPSHPPSLHQFKLSVQIYKNKAHIKRTSCWCWGCQQGLDAQMGLHDLVPASQMQPSCALMREVSVVLRSQLGAQASRALFL